jgi:hypothetical protein
MIDDPSGLRIERAQRAPSLRAFGDNELACAAIELATLGDQLSVDRQPIAPQIAT